ncbi:hypothetical protein [Burkholderia pyrrocinia]|nr:hypothetical protein [Burkholderia pyrrocinia]
MNQERNTMIGSFFLYETDRIDVLRRCVDEDPFNKAGGKYRNPPLPEACRHIESARLINVRATRASPSENPRR